MCSERPFAHAQVPRSLRGRLNGVAQALVAVARVAGPLATSNLFAWGASRPWPAYMSSFYMLAAIGFGTAALALALPPSIEKQIKEAAPSEAADEPKAVREAEPSDLPDELPDELSPAGHGQGAQLTPLANGQNQAAEPGRERQRMCTADA